MNPVDNPTKTLDNNDWDSRMIWYHKTYEDDHPYVHNTFDPIAYVYEGIDSMKSIESKLYICERKTKCFCKKNCICDSDDYYEISDVNITIGSNNNFIFDVIFSDRMGILFPRFPKKQNLRFFTLNNITD